MRAIIRPIEGVALATERVCGNCGEAVEPDAQACPWCGATFSGVNLVGQPVGPSAPEPGFGRRSEVAMIAVVAVLAIGLLGLAALLINQHNGSTAKVQVGDRQSTPTSPKRTIRGTATSTTSTTTTTTVPTTLGTSTTTSLPPGDVRAEPPGLTCAQLSARNYDYTAAVTYWQAQGQPARMDVDGNGRPCETVYSPAAVQAYWHT